jgi:hypothetical protein
MLMVSAALHVGQPVGSSCILSSLAARRGPRCSLLDIFESVDPGMVLISSMSTALATQSLIDDLLELVAALDRRVPQLERESERAIARDASALRLAALKRIAELAQPT